ncbi:glycosyltransferase 8 domain-containing protein 1 [Gastrophryne carolinensis]
MSCRKVHLIIIVLAAVVFLFILHHNLLGLSDLLKHENSDSGPVAFQPIDFLPEAPESISEEKNGGEIPVVITAVESRLGGAITAINSVHSNTKSSVTFYIVAMNDTKEHLRTWLADPKLKEVKYKILDFDPQVLEGKVRPDVGVKPLTFARYYLPDLVPGVEKIIYIDDDIVVQGDIVELYKTPIKPGQAAAFSEDCDSVTSKYLVKGAGSQYNYIGYFDYKKETIRKLGMKANTCSFNPGVFVANLTEWRRQNITKELEKWMVLDMTEELYSKTLAGSITAPPLLIVFYKMHSRIDPMWHVRHLGSSTGKRYSIQFVNAARLLHWNGHFKPWGRAASYAEIWEKWYVPDPAGKFQLIRRHTDAEESK